MTDAAIQDAAGVRWIAAGCAFGALTVGLGAFGAHALRARLEAADQLATWETAVHYQGLHALALVGYGLWRAHARASCATAGACRTGGPWAGVGFALGTLAFSGSLYGLALGGPRMLGPVTPVGGLLLLLAWLAFALEALRFARR